MADVSGPYSCSRAEMKPVPTRWPMRLYMKVGGVSSAEALNCGADPANVAGVDIADKLKATMNRWKADGLNLESGKVDYQRLATSDVLADYRPLAAALRNFDPAALQCDDERKAFWINIYNVLLIHGIVAYRAKTSLWNIAGAFERIAYIIGGCRYSLDDIEHGILRGNKAHFIIGGVRFASNDPRRQYIIERLDPRLHFALVCGASSCPPIGIYQAEALDDQLDLAARNFINDGGVVIDKAEMTASLSRIFRWYSPDFGGSWMGTGKRAPVLRFVAPFIVDADRRNFVQQNTEKLRVGYQRYDWALNV